MFKKVFIHTKTNDIMGKLMQKYTFFIITSYYIIDVIFIFKQYLSLVV